MMTANRFSKSMATGLLLSLMSSSAAFQASGPRRTRTNRIVELHQSSAVLEDTRIAGKISKTPNSNPTLASASSNYAKANQPVPALGAIAKMLPKEVFQVRTKTSLLYFGVDLVAVTGCMTALHALVTSSFYLNLPLWEKALAVAPLQGLTGFAMWCMWCIGHDAGHGTVSKSHPWVNRIVGEMAHSVVCLTPFVPWAKSHLKHHLNHNHLDRDYSHQWFIREQKDDLPLWFLWAYQLRNLQLPFLYLVYLLLGIPDGGHVWFYGRMWEGESMAQKVSAAVSSLVSIVTAASLWHALGTADFVVVCMVPWLVVSFWLFMVTYLQHHSDDGVLYTDDTWAFNRGAFETVDRDYGTWINKMSHHMMDGHVAHHLFFTKIPHYRLEMATTALKAGLEEQGFGHLYKQVDTPNFALEIVQQFDSNWFFINEAQVVRGHHKEDSEQA